MYSTQVPCAVVVAVAVSTAMHFCRSVSTLVFEIVFSSRVSLLLLQTSKLFSVLSCRIERDAGAFSTKMFECSYL